MGSYHYYLGNGPTATGGAGGWYMHPGLTARCRTCGYFMVLDPATYDTCPCGALYKDPGAARFGSALGDDQIEIYRTTA